MATASSTKTERLLADLRRIFGERLRAVAEYGDRPEAAPVTCLVLVASLDIADLDACARAASSWHREGLATPLIVPEPELRRSLDAFPLEYSEMQRAHTTVYGRDPFEGVAIAPDDLRRACETQVKSHLLHLREEYVDARGAPQAIARLVDASAPAFAALLRNVARLHGVDTNDRATATREGAQLAGLPDDIVASILALEHPAGLPSTDPARLFPQYLAAVEQVALFVDSWKA